MTVNKLPTITGYWEFRKYIKKGSMRKAMPRSKFEDIMQNWHFSNNEEADKSDTS